ncbi:hypothetical protein NVP1177O_39 [Vibrio phage 1.177.O._10N.286.45.E10]|nr:hypothetical protein NVP1177O_39 [Vibrio phage 1.177.O._10N.286.45.E10]
MKMLTVDKDTFDKIINSYHGELNVNVSGISEPPVKTYNDFSNGKVWPDSVVASVALFESYRKIEDGGVPPYSWSENTYKVREELL